MGEIKRIIRRINIEPIPDDVPVQEPSPQTAPAAPAPSEPVPA